MHSVYLLTAFLASLNKYNKVLKHSFVKIFVPWFELEMMVQINLVCHVIVFKGERIPINSINIIF